VRPAPTAGAGPEGLHSRPVLHNAEGKTLFLAIAAGEEALDRGRSRTGRRQDTTYGDSSGALGGRRGIQGTRLTGRPVSQAARSGRDHGLLGADRCRIKRAFRSTERTMRSPARTGDHDLLIVGDRA
jgi:hypothetical protein